MLTKALPKIRWNGSVINLNTGSVITAQYSQALEPRGAVIAAYAQLTRKDFNTADYEAQYGAKVLEGKFGFHLGDFSAPK